SLFLDDTTEDLGRGPRGFGLDHATHGGRLGLLEDLAASAHDASYQERSHERPVVGDRTERRHELQRRHRHTLAEAVGRKIDPRPATHVAEDAGLLARQLDPGP